MTTPRPIRRRLHLAGSIANGTDPSLARYSHQLVGELAAAFAGRGASFVVPIDREPPLLSDDAASPSITFDWTVLDATWGVIGSGAEREPRIHAVVHQKSLTQIPTERQALWNDVLGAVADARSSVVDVGDRNSGATRREAQARLGDVLIAIGGSEGVRHLAELYREAGKPVVPLNLPIGKSDGAGALAIEASSSPGEYFEVRDGVSATGLLAACDLRSKPTIAKAVAAIVALVDAIRPPTAFCVRLLNPDVAVHEDVDWYFEKVVKPVVEERGFELLTIGVDPGRTPFLNVEIFERLHRSQLVICDYTGERPNCFLELGYALGRQLPSILTAKEGTPRPFDVAALPTHPWKRTTPRDERQRLEEHWRAHGGRDPLVAPVRG